MSDTDRAIQSAVNSVAACVNVVSVVSAYGADPTGGSSSSSAIQKAANEVSGSDAAMYFPPGLYVIDKPIVLSSQTIVVMSPAVTIQSTMANTGAGGFTNSVFFATKTGQGPSNALTSDAVMGTNVINVTSPVAVGSTIALQTTTSANLQQVATVVATSNGGLTLTLDEIISYNYFTVGTGSSIYVFSPVHDVRIWGNGARVFGTGDRVCEFAWCRYVYVDGLIVDQTLGSRVNGFLNIQFSFDIGCRDCDFRHCKADGGGGYLSGTTGVAGFAREASLRASFYDCKAENFTNGANASGFLTMDSKFGEASNLAAVNCTQGYYWGANDAFGTEGSDDDALATGSMNCATGYVFDKASRVRIGGMESIGDAKVFTCPGGSSDVSIERFNWKARLSGVWNGWDAITGSVQLQDGVIDMTSTAGTKSVCDWSAGTGTLRISRCKSISGTNGLFLQDGLAQRVIRGDGVDFSSVGGTQYRKGTNSKLNFGTLTANGAANVDTVAACAPKDSVRLVQTSATSSVAQPQLVSVGADTFRINALVANANTYDWYIVPGGP